MNPIQIASLMSYIEKKSTVAALVDRTGLTRQTIYKALRALERSKVARINHWHCDDFGRAVEPVWMFGSEPSEPRPRRSNAQKQHAYRERLRIKQEKDDKAGNAAMTFMFNQVTSAKAVAND